MAPHVHEVFHTTPKPREVSWAYVTDEDVKKMRRKAPKAHDDKAMAREAKRRAAAKGSFRRVVTRHIGDLLKQTKLQRRSTLASLRTTGSKEVKALDVISCRRRALEDRPWDLPLFSPLDEFTPCKPECGRFDHTYWDFVHLDKGDERVDLLRDAPYGGPRLYCVDEVDYLWRKGVVTQKHFKAGIRAAYRVPTADVRHAFKLFDEVLADARVGFPCYLDDRWRAFAKEALLAMIGLWSCQEQHSWKAYKTKYEVDVPGRIARRVRLPDGVLELKTRTQIVDFTSMQPWSRIALGREQVLVDQAYRVLQKHERDKRLVILGSHVDCVYYQTLDFNNLALEEEILGALKLPSGRPGFQIKNERANKMPTWQSGQGQAPNVRKAAVEGLLGGRLWPGRRIARLRRPRRGVPRPQRPANLRPSRRWQDLHSGQASGGRAH